jgi:hypothetical protein
LNRSGSPVLLLRAELKSGGVTAWAEGAEGMAGGGQVIG